MVMLPGSPTAGYPRRVVTKPRREPLQSQVSEMVRRHFDLYFQQIRETFRGIRGGVAYHILNGKTRNEILEFAGASQDTLLSISIRSSVARSLIAAARCPLLVGQSLTGVPCRQDKGKVSTVLVHLDGSNLAAQVMPYAAGIAKQLGLRLLLVTSIPGMPILYEEEDIASPRKVWRTSTSEARAYLDKTRMCVAPKGPGEVITRVLGGDPETQISALASEIPGCLVALTTTGRTGIRSWLYGSVADLMIRTSPAPVLAIRATQK
jgi:nucleotide-binding universal stress UspA family protein